MLTQSKGKTLILGAGNLILSDEGVGLRALERLVQTYELPEEVHILDGGTLGMGLLYHLEGVENLLILDAVEMGEEPGTLLRLEGDEVPSFLSIKISPHQIGIPDMLAAARLRDLYPRNVVLWGVQPGVLEMGLSLSPPVAAQVDVLVEKAVEELARWGFKMTTRSDSSTPPELLSIPPAC